MEHMLNTVVGKGRDQKANQKQVKILFTYNLVDLPPFHGFMENWVGILLAQVKVDPSVSWRLRRPLGLPFPQDAVRAVLAQLHCSGGRHRIMFSLSRSLSLSPCVCVCQCFLPCVLALQWPLNVVCKQ